jgi:hypothetical protein
MKPEQQNQERKAVASHDLPMQTRLAGVAPATLNAEGRTVDLVWSTGAGVRRYDYWRDRYYVEELSLDPAHVDMSRLNAGAPLLNTHGRYDLSDVIGVVETASLENGEGRATVRFSDREDVEPIFKDVRNGIIRNVSVGYSVRKYEIVEEEGKDPIYRAVDWQPMEISMVPIGADANAGTRSAETGSNPCEYVNRATAHSNEDTMDKNDNRKSGAGAESGQEQATTTAVRSEQPAPAAPATDDKAARDAAVAAARQNDAEIRKAVRNMGFEESVADEMISRGINVGVARQELIDMHAERGAASNAIRGQAATQVGESNEDPAIMVPRMAEAVAARFNGLQPAEECRQYMGSTMAGLADDLLTARGIDTRRMRAGQIIERAMTTSDFPMLLESTAIRILLPAYEAAPITFHRIAKRMSASDFRTRNVVRNGDFPEMKPLNEHGELVSGSLTESSESFKLKTVGRRIALSREALINDDLGAFADMATGAGQAAARYENAEGWNVFLNGKLSSDGKAQFHVDHSNLAGSSGAISATTVGAGKTGIRKQKNKDGNRLNYAPSFLLGPAELETTIEQYLANVVVPTKSADVVPASHKQLEPLIEPILGDDSASAWYLMVDPMMLANIVYAYLEGAEGPQIHSRETSKVMGMEWDVYLDFAAALVDFRGGWKNP